MNIATVNDLLIAPDSFRKAWDISLACKPTWASPISPSISARGTSAATESITITSMAPLRTSDSAISRACSPVSGWDTSSSSMLTPRLAAYCGSRACSASIKAANPPRFCASATTCNATVVLPEDSGPNISITLPRGNPPTPSATSSARHPVEITLIPGLTDWPSFIIEPLPNCFSICSKAISRAFSFSNSLTPLMYGSVYYMIILYKTIISCTART